MKWAFIDYENVSNLEKIDLATYEKIIIFLGARQPKLDFGGKKYDKFLNLVVIQMKAIQANNLDFHLSYYLGKYDAIAEQEIAFEVVSNDNGYAPLIAHVKANGRSCKQVKVSVLQQMPSPISAPAPKQSVPKLPSSESKLLSSLISRPKEKRPKKLPGLKNHIASHLGLKGNDIAIQNHVNHLVKIKVIMISDGLGVEYIS